MKKVFALLLLAGALSWACNKAPEAASVLEVDVAEMTAGNKGGVKQLKITTNGAWKLEISEPWLVASKQSGQGDALVKLAVLPNADYSSRGALVTVTAGNLTKTVTLSQYQLSAIFLEEDSKTVSYEAGTYTLALETNVPVTASSDEEWLTVGETKALEEKSIQLSFPLNPARAARTAHVTVVGETLEQVFTFTQAAFAPSFEVSDEQNVGAWGTLAAPKEGLEYVFTVTTNMDYEASAPDADWIHLTVSDDKLTVKVDENTGAARSEYIYVGCTKAGVDYSDYGAMIKVAQKGTAQAVEVWKKDFYWDLYPNSTRVSAAVAGNYYVLYSPGAVTPGFHAMSRADGSSRSVEGVLLDGITGISNDDKGNLIVTIGGNYPLSEGTEQIPLKVYALTPADFLACNVGNPIITYEDGFYGYGLDNIRVTGDIFGDAVVTMTSGCGSGGSYVVAWQVTDGVTTNTPTIYSSCESIGGDLWDSYHGVSICAGDSVDDGFYFAGYLGDYNLNYTAKGGADTSWSTAFVTGYSWEGAINAADVFTYGSHKYLFAVGMNYFAYSEWGVNPCTMWVLNIDDPANPVLVLSQDYYANEDGWQYGNNTDIYVVQEENMLAAYLMDAAASTYRKYELVLE